MYGQEDVVDRQCFSLGDGVVFERWDERIARYSLLTQVEAAADQLLLKAASDDSGEEFI